jgi:hypothetical protein
MSQLQSFMSDLLSQCDCSSIDVVTDNARIPLQQPRPPQAPQAPSGPVSSPRHFDYKGTTRWESGHRVEAFSPPALGPPVRQRRDDDPVYPKRESAFSQRVGGRASSALLLNRDHNSLPKIPIRRF